LGENHSSNAAAMGYIRARAVAAACRIVS